MNRSENPSHISGRDARMAVLLTHVWQKEIERAIDRIKNFRKRSADDRWWRKRWYKVAARNKRRWDQRI